MRSLTDCNVKALPFTAIRVCLSTCKPMHLCDLPLRHALGSTCGGGEPLLEAHEAGVDLAVVNHLDIDVKLFVAVHGLLNSADDPLYLVTEGTAAHAGEKDLDAPLALQREDGGHRERGLVLGIEHSAREGLPLVRGGDLVVGHRHRRAQHLAHRVRRRLPLARMRKPPLRRPLHAEASRLRAPVHPDTHADADRFRVAHGFHARGHLPHRSTTRE
mmetsp:Transcript_22048/g.44905  ORF Transcript_22048/g.44905 Transcript_22048/m.44905 type:complete len:216 (-) Transcript_22048:625-1272(-)